MNKRRTFAIIGIVIFLVCSCAGTSKVNQTSDNTVQDITLDKAIHTSAEAIVSQLPQGSKIAVLAFTSSLQALSDHVLDELASTISAGKKTQVIERQHIDVIRKELNIQMSGDVSDAEVRRVGHQLGAQYVITGALSDLGNTYRFRVLAINVETAVREGASSLDINKNDTQIAFLLKGQKTDNKENNKNYFFDIGFKYFNDYDIAAQTVQEGTNRITLLRGNTLDADINKLLKNLGFSIYDVSRPANYANLKKFETIAGNLADQLYNKGYSMGVLHTFVVDDGNVATIYGTMFENHITIFGYKYR